MLVLILHYGMQIGYENADSDKYKYSGNGTGFDSLGSFASSDGSGFGKNVIIFGAGMSSSLHC